MPPPMPPPCRCARRSGSARTPLTGCQQHGLSKGDSLFYCLTAGSTACSGATPSVVYPGAAWRPCDPAKDNDVLAASRADGGGAGTGGGGGVPGAGPAGAGGAGYGAGGLFNAIVNGAGGGASGAAGGGWVPGGVISGLLGLSGSSGR